MVQASYISFFLGLPLLRILVFADPSRLFFSFWADFPLRSYGLRQTCVSACDRNSIMPGSSAFWRQFVFFFQAPHRHLPLALID